MYNHNKAQQSKNRVHISWDILYAESHCEDTTVVTSSYNHIGYSYNSKEACFLDGRRLRIHKTHNKARLDRPTTGSTCVYFGDDFPYPIHY